MISVRFECPACQKTRKKEIPVEDLKEKSSGLMSILINPDEECPHMLVIFIDKSHKIRGVQVVDFAPSTLKVKDIIELPQKKISLYGAYKLFGDIFIDMLSCLLQNKKLVFCGDIDVSITLFGIINKIFPEIHSLGEKVIISEEFSEKVPNSLTINTQLKVLESGKILNDAHPLIKDYINEAEEIGDEEAAILYLRQKITILFKVAEFLENNLREKTSEKNVLKTIQTDMRIKIKSSELYAVFLILSGKGKEDIVKNVSMSKFDKF